MSNINDSFGPSLQNLMGRPLLQLNGNLMSNITWFKFDRLACLHLSVFILLILTYLDRNWSIIPHCHFEKFVLTCHFFFSYTLHHCFDPWIFSMLLQDHFVLFLSYCNSYWHSFGWLRSRISFIYVACRWQNHRRQLLQLLIQNQRRKDQC